MPSPFGAGARLPRLGGHSWLDFDHVESQHLRVYGDDLGEPMHHDFALGEPRGRSFASDEPEGHDRIDDLRHSVWRRQEVDIDRRSRVRVDGHRDSPTDRIRDTSAGEHTHDGSKLLEEVRHRPGARQTARGDALIPSSFAAVRPSIAWPDTFTGKPVGGTRSREAFSMRVRYHTPAARQGASPRHPGWYRVGRTRGGSAMRPESFRRGRLVAVALILLVALALPVPGPAAPAGPPVRIGSTLALTGPLAATVLVHK